MRVVLLAAVLAACGGAPPPRPLTRTPLTTGHYESVGLRLRGQRDAALSGWTVDVDRDALRLELTGPAGHETYALAPDEDAQQPYGCPGSRQETFAIDGALEIAGVRFPEPIVLADCASAGVTIFDRTLTKDNAGPLVEFRVPASAAP